MTVDGRKVAEEILSTLRSQSKPKGFFGAAIVGDDPASLNFLKQKAKAAESLGVDFRLYRLPADITTDALRRKIGRLAGPRRCKGFIVQLPLPERIHAHYALNAIPKWKDVDVLGETALGAFYTGRHPIVPPAVATVEELLKRDGRELKEQRAVVVGKGFLIGKPLGLWLQAKVAEISILDSKVKNVEERLRDADIVISGTGVGHLFSAKGLKRGVLVIDFGWDKKDGKIAGDLDYSEAGDDISYTPTPGGTGPILVAKLFENYYRLNEASQTS